MMRRYSQNSISSVPSLQERSLPYTDEGYQVNDKKREDDVYVDRVRIRRIASAGYS